MRPPEPRFCSAEEHDSRSNASYTNIVKNRNYDQHQEKENRGQ